MNAKYYTEQDVLERMRATIRDLGSQQDLAEAAGVSPSFVCDVLAGRRPPTGNLLVCLGYRAETVYFPIK